MLSNRLLKPSLLSKMVAKREVAYVAGKGYHVCEGQESASMQDMINHLDKYSPTFTCLYFTAGWNPMCAKIEKDYENFVSENQGLHHIRVDCDKHPKVKRYFDAQVEPQFLLLVNGAEMKRMIGYNFHRISSDIQRAQQAHQENGFGYYGDSGKSWERFYDEYDKFARYGEERDAFKAQIEQVSDQHRGPGTDRP